ncbi:hypothetical protein NC651_034992 [Populus alba x Populus x berolinensis]|nr:hypothetical protein NC651_034992 [Populus alba x Populus x berolinensis]
MVAAARAAMRAGSRCASPPMSNYQYITGRNSQQLQYRPNEESLSFYEVQSPVMIGFIYARNSNVFGLYNVVETIN